MQPDPTTPALTAMLAEAAESTGLSLDRNERDWGLLWAQMATYGPLAALAAQQPDERVAGLVEALDEWATTVRVPAPGDYRRAQVEVWGIVHAQPTAAGGAAGYADKANRWLAEGMMTPDQHGAVMAVLYVESVTAVGGAAGERCAFVSQWGPCGETLWGMCHSHTITCRHPDGHPDFASCHPFTPPAAGGAESRTEAVRRMQREGGGPVTAVMVSRTAGGAAGEEHLPECGGNIVCCSCHIFTPPAAPDGLP
jgi:hypothetical protein